MANEVEEKSEVESILAHLPDAAELLGGTGANGAGDKVAADAADEGADEAADAADEGLDTDGADAAEGVDEGESDGADDGAEEDEPKPDAVQKRIDKLVSRAKSAEEQAAELSAKVAAMEAKLASAGQVEQPAAVAGPIEGLSAVDTPTELEGRLQTALQVKRWCIENPDGGTVTRGDGNEVEIEPQQARKMLADAEELITLHIPRRHRYLQDREQHEAVAKVAYPSLYEKGSEDARAADVLLKMWPEVRRFPDWRLVIGDYMRGFRERAAANGKKKEVPAAKTRLAPPVPKAPAASKPRSRDTKGDALHRVMEGAGSLDSVAEYFAKSGN